MSHARAQAVPSTLGSGATQSAWATAFAHAAEPGQLLLHQRYQKAHGRIKHLTALH